LMHGEDMTTLVPAFAQLLDQCKQAIARSLNRGRLYVKGDLGSGDPVTAKVSFVLRQDRPRVRRLRADDDNLGPQPRIRTRVGPDIEAMARPLKLRDRQTRFQCADRLGRDDLHTVETGPKDTNIWDRPLRGM